MSDPLRVVAYVDIKPGEEAAVQAAARECAVGSRAEQGCLEFTVHRPAGENGRLVFVETWQSKAALETHMQTAHFKKFAAVVERSAKGPPDIQELEPLF